MIVSHRIVVLFLLVLTASCSTIINSKTQRIKIRSTVEDAAVKINDSVYPLPAKVVVLRSKVPLQLEFIHDSITEQKTLKPSVSPKFVFGNLMALQLALVAYGVDLTNQKRFYYNKSFTLNPGDTATVVYTTLERKYRRFAERFTRQYPTAEGQVNVGFAIPYVTNFYQNPNGRSAKSVSGFVGISATGEYYYKDNRYLALGATAVIDAVPLPIEYFDEYETFRSSYIAVTDNVKVRRFTFGYGPAYTTNVWKMLQRENELTGEPLPDIVSRKQYLGLMANSYFQLSRLFFVGIKYNPALYDLSASRWDYEHTVSLDVMIKLRVKK